MQNLSAKQQEKRYYLGNDSPPRGGSVLKNQFQGGGGGWGGVNNIPLDIHLHDDLFLLIASTVPRHTDALRLIDDVGLGWGGGPPSSCRPPLILT